MVLGEIGDERAAPPLIRLLGDVNDAVRKSSKEALRRIFEAGSVARIGVALRECSFSEKEAALKLISAIDPIKAEMITNVGEDENIPLEEEAAAPSKEGPPPEKESSAEMMRKLRKVLREVTIAEAKVGKG